MSIFHHKSGVVYSSTESYSCQARLHESSPQTFQLHLMLTRFFRSLHILKLLLSQRLCSNLEALTLATERLNTLHTARGQRLVLFSEQVHIPSSLPSSGNPSVCSALRNLSLRNSRLHRLTSLSLHLDSETCLMSMKIRTPAS